MSTCHTPHADTKDNEIMRGMSNFENEEEARARRERAFHHTERLIYVPAEKERGGRGSPPCSQHV